MEKEKKPDKKKKQAKSSGPSGEENPIVVGEAAQKRTIIATFRKNK